MLPPKPLQLLSIGCTSEYMCNDPRETFKGQLIELLTLDIDSDADPDLLCDIRKPIQSGMTFDVVYMSHVLEHVEREKLKTVMENLNVFLKPGGELYVFVPSLEWACREVLKGNESIVIQGSLYGGQKDEWDTHKVAFSVKALAALLQSFGFAVRKAGMSKYLSIVNGKNFDCWQNYAIGVKS